MNRFVMLMCGALFFSAQAQAAQAQICNAPSGFLQSQGPITLNDLLILGPDCTHVQDGGAVPVPSPPTRVLLATLTASASANLQDTTHITSTYPDYEILLENLIPASVAFCRLQVHSNSAFQATTYLATSAGWNSNLTTGPNQPTTYIPCSISGTGQLAGTPGISGDIKLFGASTTVAPKNWVGTFGGQTAGPVINYGVVNGFWNGGNTAIDGIQIDFVTTFNAGGPVNITSGIVKIYGLQ
jgi:hypothetical protein